MPRPAYSPAGGNAPTNSNCCKFVKPHIARNTGAGKLPTQAILKLVRLLSAVIPSADIAFDDETWRFNVSSDGISQSRSNISSPAWLPWIVREAILPEAFVESMAHSDSASNRLRSGSVASVMDALWAKQKLAQQHRQRNGIHVFVLLQSECPFVGFELRYFS